MVLSNFIFVCIHVIFYVSCTWGSMSFWICDFIVFIKFGEQLGNSFSNIFSDPLPLLSFMIPIPCLLRDIAIVPELADALLTFNKCFFSLYFILDSF